ncbi:MAG TPA: sigma-70 family RNA polymerase sigma factor [Fimbriiglobus sp.]|nr:sigma-70 family RNA polymerase sigma factor [Fimbriiglobus sp.]
MADETDGTDELARRAAAGDPTAWQGLIAATHDRLRRMVDLRLDRRLSGRVDPSDVLRDGFADAMTKLPEYLADPKLSLFLWLRLLVGERLAKVHGTHFGTRVRDAALEVSIYRDALPAASSAALAAQLLGKFTSPTEAAVRADRMLRVQEAVNALDPIDREIIALRNFEELSRAEAAAALGIEEAAAAKRYVRAIKRLKNALGDAPGGDSV